LIVVSLASSALIPRINGYETKQRKTSSLDTGAIELAHIALPHDSKVTQLTAWRQRRSLMIVFIAFAIIFSEGAASIWLPVALVEEGWSQSAAVFCYTVFAVGATTVRLFGNRIADALGRRRVVNFSAVIAALGIGLFMLSPLIGLEYLAAVVWSIGNAIGLAMCVAAMGDDPRMTSARMSMLWNTVYFANLIIGPAIGIISEFVGLYWAFSLPLVLMLAILFVSKAVETEKLTARI
jgi:MFS family permease